MPPATRRAGSVGSASPACPDSPASRPRSGLVAGLLLVVCALLASACAPSANDQLKSFAHGTWECTTAGAEGPQQWILKVGSGLGWNLHTGTAKDRVGTAVFRNGELTLEVPDARNKQATHRYVFGKVSLKDNAVNVSESVRTGKGPFVVRPLQPGRFRIHRQGKTVTVTAPSNREGITAISCTKE